MTELGFYHLTRSSLEEALPRLLEKVVASGKRAVLRAAEEERLDALNRALWTYGNDSFLPHGAKADGNAADQPVYLTTGGENPNGATVLVLVDAAPAEDLAAFERCAEMFDGRDERAVGLARARWREAAAAGHQVVYWQQNERGGWVRGGGSGGSGAGGGAVAGPRPDPSRDAGPSL